MTTNTPMFRIVGDAGLLVQFGDKIDRETNLRVHELVQALEAARHPGIIEIIPAYSSLLINYDPVLISVETCVEIVCSGASDPETRLPQDSPGLIEIPVMYGSEFGPDLEFVANHNGVSVDEVVRIHSSGDYMVYMLGFTPGFAYLGGMSEKIAAPRLGTPRDRVEPGSVGIANSQTGIYPIPSAGGWRLIGRTPIRLFRPDEKDPFLYKAGDIIRFRPICRDEFDDLAKTYE